MCIVSDENKQAASLTEAGNQNYKIYSYKTYLSDLERQPGKCTLFDTIVYSKPLVFLTANAYKNPSAFRDIKYIGKDEVEEIENYLQGISRRNRASIKESIIYTAGLFNTLQGEFIQTLSTRQDGIQYASWAYIGTEDGVFMTDSRLPDSYDHHVRGWYIDAKERRGFLTLSLPYEDASSFQQVLTLAKTLYAGKSSGVHSLDDQVLAVAGMDFLLPQMFHQLIMHRCRSQGGNGGKCPPNILVRGARICFCPPNILMAHNDVKDKLNMMSSNFGKSHFLKMKLE